MKIKSLLRVFTVSVLALSATACSQKQPTDTTTFFCGSSKDGVPTTFVQTTRGKISMIRWVSSYFTPSGYEPQRRCDQVSSRFQAYQNQGILNFITTGLEQRQEVICVSNDNGGPCSGLLFTLKPGESASRVIQGLFDIGRYGLNPIQQSSDSSERVYIDIKTFLETAPIETK